jgi:hypothetical protein
MEVFTEKEMRNVAEYALKAYKDGKTLGEVKESIERYITGKRRRLEILNNRTEIHITEVKQLLMELLEYSGYGKVFLEGHCDKFLRHKKIKI